MILSFSLFLLYRSYFVKDENFSYVFPINNGFNIIEELTNLINRKVELNNIWGSNVSKTYFKELNLIEAPIYVIKGKALNDSHLKLYKSALEKIEYMLNVILLDKDLKINNKNINLIKLKTNSLNYKKIALINSLNLNNNFLKENAYKNEIKVDKIDDLKNFNNTLDDFRFDANGFYNCLEKGNIKEIKLISTPYKYKILKKNKKHQVFDIFGEEILKIEGEISCQIINNKLIIKSLKNQEIKINIKLNKNELNNLELLNLKINCEKYQKYINKLKENAILMLKNDIFLIKNKIKKIKTKNLFNYLKLSILRKNYFNDYLFLLNYIYGIYLNNFVLISRPLEVVDEDFSIEYIWNGEVKKVFYKKMASDMVKLNYVGHKMGTTDKYVFGF